MNPTCRRSPLLLIAVAGLALSLGVVTFAQAQGYAPRRPRRYEPATPTLSPYLNYFRADRGPISNYHTYVRPEEKLRRAFTSQRTELRRQERSLRGLKREVHRVEQFGSAAPTGTSATFFNYSHFYPGLQQ